MVYVHSLHILITDCTIKIAWHARGTWFFHFQKLSLVTSIPNTKPNIFNCIQCKNEKDLMLWRDIKNYLLTWIIIINVITATWCSRWKLFQVLMVWHCNCCSIAGPGSKSLLYSGYSNVNWQNMFMLFRFILYYVILAKCKAMCPCKGKFFVAIAIGNWIEIECISMMAPHSVWYTPPKLMQHQGRWHCMN